MLKQIEQYVHHNKLVWVRSDLKGKHRDNCLCYCCNKFFPEDREKNCSIANSLYELCCSTNIVTPVWECEEFGFKYI